MTAAAADPFSQLAQPPASGGGTPAPPPFDHVVVAAGSGGTAAGLALGMRLSPLSASLHAVNVQHSSWSKMCPACGRRPLCPSASLVRLKAQAGRFYATRSAT